MRSTRTITGFAAALGLLLAVAALVVGSPGSADAASGAPSARRGLPSFSLGGGGVIVTVIVFAAVVILRVVQHRRGRWDED